MFNLMFLLFQRNFVEDCRFFFDIIFVLLIFRLRESHTNLNYNSKLLMMMMLRMNCSCGMVDLRTARSRISRRDHRQEASLLRLPNRLGWKLIPIPDG